MTGPAPATLDEFGNEQINSALKSLDRKGISPDAESDVTATIGSRVVHFREQWGQSYLVDKSPSADGAIAQVVRTYSSPTIETDASANVHIEMRKTACEMLLHFVNPERLWKKSVPEAQLIFVKLALPSGLAVTKVQLTSPQMQAAKEIALPFAVDENWVSFHVPVQAYAMVILTTQPRP